MSHPLFYALSEELPPGTDMLSMNNNSRFVTLTSLTPLSKSSDRMFMPG